MRELQKIPALRAALGDARDYTLRLYAHLTPEQRDFPYLRTVNPPAWEIAHVGWFQEFWCLRFRQGAEPLPARLPNADPLLNSAIIPHAQRWKRPELGWHVVRKYLARELQDTLESLERSSPDRRYFFQLALFHEDMHGEALLMSLQTLGLPEPKWLRTLLPAPNGAEHLVAGEIEFDGGEFEMGSSGGPDFAFDNEMPAQALRVAPFALATTAVTNAEFLRFVEAGGYGTREYWTSAGWQWRGESNAQAPRYWRKDGTHWQVRRFDRWETLAPGEPIVHVNAFEAEAWCSFSGRRLPTEVEWEYAARHGLAAGEDRYPWGRAAPKPGALNLDGTYGRPVHVGALAGGDSRDGLRQMIGNAWEWTATDFTGYPGFEPGHYREYSQPWFGNHRVLRGGCFATRSRLAHNRFRNFYTPDRNDIFAGFRTARTLS